MHRLPACEASAALACATSNSCRGPLQAWRQGRALEHCLASQLTTSLHCAQIEVPGNWETQGHGYPIYTNFQYPFPITAPWVPEENPTGCYRRTFTLDTALPRDRRVALPGTGRTLSSVLASCLTRQTCKHLCANTCLAVVPHARLPPRSSHPQPCPNDACASLQAAEHCSELVTCAGCGCTLEA